MTSSKTYSKVRTKNEIGEFISMRKNNRNSILLSGEIPIRKEITEGGIK